MRETWATHHPTWQLKLWDEKSITALVDSDAYAWFAPTFHALPSKIQKADAARYVILHADGGVYADLDVEAFRAFDEVLEAAEARASVQFFEEPATHWKAHGTVLSNGLIASPAGHPLLGRLLTHGVRPIAEVFKSGGSHMLQRELEGCVKDEVTTSADAMAPCGCYLTRSAERFFPVHEAMRRPDEFPIVREHVYATEALVEDVIAGRWPPALAYTAQYWTVSWIDPEIGAHFLEGLQAARRGDEKQAERLLLAATWSKWGTKYKYRNQPQPPAAAKARHAFEKSLEYAPSYAFAYYELGNLRLEEAQAPKADDAAKHKALQRAAALMHQAVSLRPQEVLFVNNLGVAKLNSGQPAEALPHFESVLELQQKAFGTVAGLDPEAGAHLNIGHALHTMGRTEEAAEHWLRALEQGSYEYAVQAVQRMHAAERKAALPPQARIDLLYGDALTKAGRSREAAMRFASAYMGAPRDEQAGSWTVEGAELRQLAHGRMDALAEVWDEAERDSRAAPAPPSRRQADAEPKTLPTIVQASADGSTTVQQLTPEMLAEFQAAQQGHA